MYNFLTVNPGDNPNEGRNKINYNFSLISGGTGGGSGLTGDYLSLSGGTVSGNTYFSANLSGETYFSGSTPLTTIIQNIANQYGGLPAGNTYEVQFNGGGFFNASSKFKFNPNDNTLVEGYMSEIYNSSDSTIIGSISTCVLNSDKVSLINSENVIVSANSKNVTIIGSGTKEIPTFGNPGSITVENSNNLLITNLAPIRTAHASGDIFIPSTIKNADGVIATGILGTCINGSTTGQTYALDLTFLLAGNIYNSSNIHAKNSDYFNVQNSQHILSFFGENSYIYNNSSIITDIQTNYSNVNNSIRIFTINSNNSCTIDSNIIGRFGAINSKIYNSNYSSIINAGFNNAPILGYSGCSKIYDSNGAMIIGGSETRSYLLGGTFFSPNEINYSDSSSVLFGFGNLISGSSYGCSAFNMIQLGIANKIYDSESVVIFRGDNNYIKSNEKVIVIGSQNSCLNNTQNSAIINGYYAEISNSKHSTVVSSINSYIQNKSYSSALIGGSNNSITFSPLSSIIGGSGNTISDSEHSTVVSSINSYIQNQSYSSALIGGSNNLINFSSRSAIIGGQNFSLTSENDTVLVPNLKVVNSISSISGATFFSGITGDYILGTNTVTIINGIITGIL